MNKAYTRLSELAAKHHLDENQCFKSTYGRNDNGVITYHALIHSRVPRPKGHPQGEKWNESETLIIDVTEDDSEELMFAGVPSDGVILAKDQPVAKHA